MIAIWTLKNPNYPEQFIKTEKPALSVKFSKLNPHLLACGFMDGNLSIYDTR